MRNRLFLFSLFFSIMVQAGVSFAQACLDDGISLYNSGDYKEAISTLEDCIASTPTTSSAYEYLAKSYVAIDDDARAIVVLEQANTQIPNSVQILFLLGQLYGNQKRYSKARVVLEQCEKLAPNQKDISKLLSRIYFNIGVEFAKDSRYKEAWENFNMAISADSSNEAAYLSAIGSLIELQKFEKARDLAETGKKLFPSNKDIEKGYLQALFGLKDYAKALPILEKTRKSDPGNIELALQIALLYRYYNRIPEALALYDTLITQYPSERPVYDALIDYWSLFNRQDKIREAYQRLALVFPYDDSITFEIAKTYEKENNWAEARKTYGESLERDSLNLDARLAIADTYLSESNDSLAISELESCLQINGNNFNAFKRLNSIYSKQKSYANSLQLCRKFQAANDTMFYPAYNLGLAFMRTGNMDSARIFFNLATKLSAVDPLPWGELASISSSKGDVSKAEEQYRHALDLGISRLGILQNRLQAAITDPQGNIRLNEVDRLKGEQDNLKDLQDLISNSLNYLKRKNTNENFSKLLDEYINEYPTSIFLLLYQAESYEFVKKYDQALELYKKIIFINPNTAQAHENMAHIYENIGNYPEAISSYQRLVSLNPENENGYDGIIRISQKQGKLDELCAEWKILYQAQPENKTLQQRLIEVLHKTGQMEEAKKIIESNNQARNP